MPTYYSRTYYFKVKRLFGIQTLWTPKEISEQLKISRVTTHRHLKTLLRKELIAKHGEGTQTVYRSLKMVRAYPEYFVPPRYGA